MARTVKVNLSADIADYRVKMREAGQITRGHAGELDKVGSKADAAGRKSAAMGKDMAQAGKTGAAGLALSEKAAANLERQIQDTAREIQRLEKDFQKTGDLNLFDDLGRQLTKLQKQVKARDIFSPKDFAAAGADAAKGTAASFAVNLGPLMAKLPASGGSLLGAGSAIAAPIAASAAAAVGAAVAGAVVGGVGVGGIVGGIALAARDPRVKAEAAELGDDLIATLERSAGVMVPVTRRAIADLRGELGGLEPEFRKIFAGASRLVDPLVQGAVGLARNALPGIVTAIERARPVFDVLADRLPDIGDAISDALSTISGDAEGAAAGVDLILEGLAGIIRVGGDIIGFFVGMFRTLVNVADAALTVEEALLGWNPLLAPMLEKGRERLDHLNAVLDGTASATRNTAGGIHGVSEAAERAAEHVEGLKKAFDDLFGVQVSLDEAALRSREAMANLTESIKENGRTINLNTEAGRANREAVLNRIKTIRDERQARIDNGMQMDVANGKYVREIDALRKTLKQAGFTQKQIDTLTAAYRRIPERANTVVGVTGDKAVINRLQTLYAYQNALRVGKPMADIRKQLSKDNADFLKFDTGGWTGPGHTHEPAGIVHADEFVIKKTSRQRIERQHPGLLDEMNATGQMPPGYARGGWVWPYPVTAAGTRIPSQREAASKVTPSFGAWPSSPGAQRGDSGVWRQIMAMVRASGIPYSFGNSYRHGDPLWHGSGRAVDLMGYNQDRLAQFFMSMQSKVLELIHTTNQGGYYITRGRRQASMGVQDALHRNHLHVAMANGGVIGEPVYGVGASGASYSFGETGPEMVTPMTWTPGPAAAAAPATRTVVVDAVLPITLGDETIVRRVRLEVDTALGQLADARVYNTA